MVPCGSVSVNPASIGMPADSLLSLAPPGAIFIGDYQKPGSRQETESEQSRLGAQMASAARGLHPAQATDKREAFSLTTAAGARNPDYSPVPRMRGSSASRNPSPRKLKANMVIANARPGSSAW
jgi:hypothetical protein